MGINIYIETSVVSYYTARPSRDIVVAGHQQATHDLWERLDRDYEPLVSAVVIEESKKEDAEQSKKRLQAVSSFRVFQITPETERLASQIIVEKGVPSEYPEDALHIAFAAIGGVDFLVTWNFAHINNPFTRMMIRSNRSRPGGDIVKN